MHNSGEDKPAPALDPIDRVSEVIFGLLMAMTFVGSLSVASSGQENVRTMMITALGCNLAWGLADAVIFLVRTFTERTRHRTLLMRLCKEVDAVKGQSLIADALPPRIAAAADAEGLETLRRRLIEGAGASLPPRLSLRDVQTAMGIFLLVVFATFPVVVPFMLIGQAMLAVRVSNLVALGMLFVAGWILGRYAGTRPWRAGMAMAIIGTLLMSAIMALGG